jgi:5'-methylthioadenosine phosphorylase
MSDWVLGVLGGSGLYDIPGLTGSWRTVDTPWGAPSDQLFDAELDGQRVVFLPRHGRGHKVPPSAINYRANVDALKRLGVTDLLSVSAVGSLKEEHPPGHFVAVDQYIDREKSFFGPGCVAHVSVADPVCPRLTGLAVAAARDAEAVVSEGGTYLVMEGPQFSTRAESNLYRSWGCAVIGMTNMPEAKLAREAEMCYASVAMVTDFDCWHPDHDHVTVDSIIKVLVSNAEKARALVKAVAPRLNARAEACVKGCHTALDNAIITAPDARDPVMLEKLDLVVKRALGRG